MMHLPVSASKTILQNDPTSLNLQMQLVSSGSEMSMSLNVVHVAKDLIPQTPVYAHQARTMMLTYIDIQYVPYPMVQRLY